MKTKMESLFLVVLFAIATYGLVLDITITIIITILFALTLFLVVLPSIQKVKKSEQRFDEINQLMHNLIIQLGATPSLFTSLENLKPYLTNDLNEKLIEGTSLEEYMPIIESYYNQPLLKRFLKALSVYDEQGGDFMALTELIITDVLFTKHWLAKLKITKLNKIVNLLSLWSLSFIVLIYLRVGLKVYYLALLQQSFVYIIIIVLLGFMYSLIIAIQSYAQLAKEG